MAAPTNTSGLLQVDNATVSSTLTLPFTATAGRDMVFTLSHFRNTGPNIASITMGGTSATRDVNQDNGQSSAQIWLAQNVAGGTNQVVVTWGTASEQNYISGAVDEWASGVLVSPALDAGTPGSASGTSATPSASTAATTSQASTVTYAALCLAAASTNNNITGPDGWTATYTEQNSDAHQGGRGAWLEQTTAGVKTATFGVTSTAWLTAIVAYKLSGGGGGTSAPVFLHNLRQQGIA